MALHKIFSENFIWNFGVLRRVKFVGFPVKVSGLSQQDRSESWLNQIMFARRIRVEYEQNGARHACSLKWLDSFSMRNFTNASVFDDTLPVSDGLMEIGAKVPTVSLRDSMEDWFRKKSYLPAGATLVISEIESCRNQG